MSVIYEVTLYIDAGIEDEYDEWLDEHIAEMHELPGFVGTEKFHLEMDEKPPKRIGRVVHYRLESREAYDDYLKNHADRMRDQGQKRFAGRFSAARRILIPA